MDPWVLAAEWWWIAPVAVGAGTVSLVGLRRRSTKSGRRLAYDAARHDLRQAQAVAVERRMATKVARADVAQIAAERTARRATAEQVANAKRMLRETERDAKAAAADVRAKQVRVNVARSAIPAASAPRPLERLHAEHDAVTAQWMRYETDPALLIAYPAMSDVKQPATVAYLRAAGHANDLRRNATGRITPAEFAVYRDAVTALARAFEAAERAARAHAGELPPPPAWQDTAQDMLSRSAEALERATGAAASVFAAWTDRTRPERDERPDHEGRPDDRGGVPPAQPDGDAPRPPEKGPIWPVPRRDRL